MCRKRPKRGHFGSSLTRTATPTLLFCFPPTHPGEEVAGVSSLSEMVPARYSWGSAGRDLEQRNQKGWCQFLSQCLPICEEEKSVREWPAYLYIYTYTYLILFVYLTYFLDIKFNIFFNIGSCAPFVKISRFVAGASMASRACRACRATPRATCCAATRSSAGATKRCRRWLMIR